LQTHLDKILPATKRLARANKLQRPINAGWHITLHQVHIVATRPQAPENRLNGTGLAVPSANPKISAGHLSFPNRKSPISDKEIQVSQGGNPASPGEKPISL
jgi:hypothetical protein